MLWAAAMFAWFFLSALYLQLVLGYTPLKVGLSFLPGNIVMGILSVSVSARVWAAGSYTTFTEIGFPLLSTTGVLATYTPVVPIAKLVPIGCPPPV